MTRTVSRLGRGIARTLALLCLLLGMAVVTQPAAAAPNQDAALPASLTQRDDEEETPEAEEDEEPAEDDERAVEEDADPDDVYDAVVFGNGVSSLTLFGDPDYEVEQLGACVGDYLAGLEDNDGVSDIEQLDDPDAEGEDDDRAWDTYTYLLTTED